MSAIDKLNYILDHESSIDHQRLHKISGGERGIEIFIAEAFIEHAIENLSLLRQSIKDLSDDSWTEISHKLAGGASDIGAVKLASICRQAQEFGKSSDEKSKEYLHLIESEMGRVLLCLKEEYQGDQ